MIKTIPPNPQPGMPYLVPCTTEFYWQEREQNRQRQRAAARKADLKLKVLSIRAAIALNPAAPPSIGTVSGIAVPFELFGRPDGRSIEIIGPGAVDDLLAGADDVRLLVDHDPAIVFSRRSDFSLRLSKSADGLRFEADIVDSEAGEALAQIIEAGRINGFSFNVLPGSIFETETVGVLTCRYVKRLVLSEITLTTGSPAFPQTADTLTWKRR